MPEAAFNKVAPLFTKCGFRHVFRECVLYLWMEKLPINFFTWYSKAFRPVSLKSKLTEKYFPNYGGI